jgi:hypothetical protein
MIGRVGGQLLSPLPSFPSALQLRVSFGLLNNQPPFLSPDDEASNGRMKNEKNVDGRGRSPLIFADSSFIPSIRG